MHKYLLFSECLKYFIIKKNFLSFVTEKTRPISSPRPSPWVSPASLLGPAQPVLLVRPPADVATALKSSSSEQALLSLSTGEDEGAVGRGRQGRELVGMRSECISFTTWEGNSSRRDTGLPSCTLPSRLACLPSLLGPDNPAHSQVFNDDTGQVFNPVSKPRLPAESL